MDITRRAALRIGGLGAAAAAAAAGGVSGTAHAAATARRRGTTLARRIVRGRDIGDGYRLLRRIDGEGHLVRDGLDAAAKPGRARRRAGLTAFVQLSDVHIIDAQSPLRVEYADRYDDTGDLPSSGVFGSAYRPQEILTAQVADAMVRRINAVRRGPVTGIPFRFAVQTGDNSDNSQLNEIRWNIRVLDGGRVRPDSGSRAAYEGVMDQDRTSYDRHYWHPDGAPDGKRADIPRRRYGFPLVPGLLDAARRPFKAAGLDMRWYTAFGNHDGLIQGNFPERTTNLNAVATGSLKLISPPAGYTPADLQEFYSRGDLQGFLTSLAEEGDPSVRQVTPDPRRRLLSRSQYVEQHFRTTGLPVGHGFTARNQSDGTAYYAFTRGPLRVIVLDTVNPNGYADGSLDATQFAWLQAQLAAASRKLIVVCSHHNSETMDNVFVATGGDLEPRVVGAQVVAALQAQPNVIAWINGHTHRHAVTPRPAPGGGGFWEITTSSHVDHPQHARILEIADNQDGTLSLFCTLVDHASPVRFGGDLSTPKALASLARELAANDWQRRDVDQQRRADRNVELLVRRPAWMG